MSGRTTDGGLGEKARKALMARWSEKRSWKVVAADLSNGHALDRAMLCRIANGRQTAPNSVLQALGLPLKMLPATACLKCGAVHTTTRCTRRASFDETARAYDEWKKKNAAKIAAIVEWAEEQVKA